MMATTGPVGTRKLLRGFACPATPGQATPVTAGTTTNLEAADAGTQASPEVKITVRGVAASLAAVAASTSVMMVMALIFSQHLCKARAACGRMFDVALTIHHWAPKEDKPWVCHVKLGVAITAGVGAGALFALSGAFAAGCTWCNAAPRDPKSTSVVMVMALGVLISAFAFLLEGGCGWRFVTTLTNHLWAPNEGKPRALRVESRTFTAVTAALLLLLLPSFGVANGVPNLRSSSSQAVALVNESYTAPSVHHQGRSLLSVPSISSGSIVASEFDGTNGFTHPHTHCHHGDWVRREVPKWHSSTLDPQSAFIDHDFLA
eukprot:CAMPEP_0173444598 /NCGR_PEP_ID=MMETSP1357-20121228/32561_1 /TAXON_ID=77926 /ORGANISM="Hemiselmis rufescens, Strain PCC563" /LENGTH=317 /DNA_ID=CAMNT_0014410657 /DNA_START=256 /DNA_END=1209 /DNA_ORIENTATION=-